MLPLCASLLAHPMKPSCSIEQGGVTQPHSEGNITGPIANILYGEVVKKKRDPILPPIGSNIGNPNKFDTLLSNKQTLSMLQKERLIPRRSRSMHNNSMHSNSILNKYFDPPE